MFKLSKYISVNCFLRILTLGIVLGFVPPSHAESLLDGFLQQRANAFLTVISYSLTPDVTTGSLSLNSGLMNNPELGMTSLGG